MKDKLQKDIQELEEALEIKKAMLAEEQRLTRIRRGNYALDNVNVLLTLVPEHDRTSCSDENPTNYGQCRCTRCVLLKAAEEKWWDDNVVIRIELTYSGQSSD